MNFYFDALSILAEVTTAFVSLAVIVATLRMTLGAKLTSFQKLLVQFFTVSGMLGVSAMLIPFVFASLLKSKDDVISYSLTYAGTVTLMYLIVYLRQRIAIKAPTPMPSIFVMSGYALSVALLTLTKLGIYWTPTLGMLVLYGFWVLGGSVIIFVYFLSDFVNAHD